jgi:hypothetical protein
MLLTKPFTARPTSEVRALLALLVQKYKYEKPGLFAEAGTFHGTHNVGGTSLTSTIVRILTAEAVCGAQSTRHLHDVC